MPLKYGDGIPFVLGVPVTSTSEAVGSKSFDGLLGMQVVYIILPRGMKTLTTLILRPRAFSTFVPRNSRPSLGAYGLSRPRQSLLTQILCAFISQYIV